MKASIKIGIVREEKVPVDNRSPFTPAQVQQSLQTFPDIDFYVQPSDLRCFPDEEYVEAGATLSDNLEHCDVLFGVKEVPVGSLIPGKTWFFFSHTIKKQEYNRKLLKEVLRRDIRLVDYECLTGTDGQRLVAFGRWAGIVGAYNGLRLWAARNRQEGPEPLLPCHEQEDFDAVKRYLKSITFEPFTIAVSGDGRVARGAWELLDAAGIREVSIEEYMQVAPSGAAGEPVYVKLRTEDLYRRKSDGSMQLADFFARPGDYECLFHTYIPKTDLFINAIFWHPDAPVFFDEADMSQPEFRIRAIADITCDIDGSVPATIRATTIDDPFMGIDRTSGKEVPPFGDETVDVMSVDNLPNELPRDASAEFGDALMKHVLPDLTGNGSIIERATIARNGRLMPDFAYLDGWVSGS